MLPRVDAYIEAQHERARAAVQAKGPETGFAKKRQGIEKPGIVIKPSCNRGLLRAVSTSEPTHGVGRRRPLSISNDLDLRHPFGHSRVPGLLSPRFPAHP